MAGLVKRGGYKVVWNGVSETLISALRAVDCFKIELYRGNLNEFNRHVRHSVIDIGVGYWKHCYIYITVNIRILLSISTFASRNYSNYLKPTLARFRRFNDTWNFNRFSKRFRCLHLRAKANIKFLILGRPWWWVNLPLSSPYLSIHISNALKLLTHPITASLSIAIFHSKLRDGIDRRPPPIIYFISSGKR